MGGVGIAFLITLVGARVLDFLPSDEPPSRRRHRRRRRLEAAAGRCAGSSSPQHTSLRARRRSPSGSRRRCARAVSRSRRSRRGRTTSTRCGSRSPSGRRCRNLDPYLTDATEIRAAFARHAAGADVALVEGNKGLYDGLALDGSNSNAALATMLDLPVVLVIDARGMTRGIAPLILGYQAFDRDIRIAGVILNQLGGSRHEAKLRAVIEHYTDVPVLGAVHHDPAPRDRRAAARPHAVQRSGRRGGAHRADRRRCRAPGRHRSAARGGRRRACARVPDTRSAATRDAGAAIASDLRIGIAQDRAFGFYYADDLDALRAAGATLVPFDTLADAQLPDVDALVIGGGFPELFARELEANGALRDRIGAAIDAGLPVYAECGGLMYLARSLTREGHSYRMVGAIDGDVVMHERPVGRGYVVLDESPAFPWPAERQAAPRSARTNSTTRASRTWRPTRASRTGSGAVTASTASATAS